MKKTLNFLIKKPILIVFLIILVIYFPVGLASPAEELNRFYPATISLDLKENNNFEIGIIVFLTSPSTEFDEKYFLLTGEGPSITEALESISKTVGKKITLTHTTAIVVGKSLAETKGITALDHLFRNETISNDTYLICSNGSALDLIKIEEQTLNSLNISWEEIARYNSRNNFFADLNLKSFYKGYFSPTNTSIMGVMEAKPEVSEQFQKQTTGGSSGGQEQGPNSVSVPQNDFLENKMDLGVFYQGKLVGILTKEDINAWNWTNSRMHDVTIEINNVSDQNFNDATLTFTVKSNKVKIRTYFEKQKPIVEYNISLALELSEIEKNMIEEQDYSTEKNFLTPYIKSLIEQKAKTEFSTLLKKIIPLKTDILEVYSHLNHQHYFKFSNWLNNLQNPENYLQEIEYRMTVNSELTK